MTTSPRRAPRLAALCALLLALAAADARAQAPTTVILVRHAEKVASDGRDPPLTETGAARASALVEVLADAGVAAVYSTPFIRTRETAAPLAGRLGLPVTLFPVEGGAEAHARALAREVLERHAGRVVLVVGHSNTVPLIVGALGASEPPALGEGDYDRLFIVTVPPEGEARVIRARYGAGS